VTEEFGEGGGRDLGESTMMVVCKCAVDEDGREK